MNYNDEQEFEQYLGQFPLRNMPPELHERIFGQKTGQEITNQPVSYFYRHKLKWAVAALLLITAGTATLYFQPDPPVTTTATVTTTIRQEPITMEQVEMELLEAQMSAQLLALAKMNFEMGTSRGYILCQEIVEKYPDSMACIEARTYLENNNGNVN